MPSDGELLLEYARRGDASSLAALVERHAKWMVAFLRGMLPSAADADDAFQATWIRVIESAGRYRGGNVRSYLACVARSVAIDRLRAQGRFVSLDAEAESSGEICVAAEVVSSTTSSGDAFEARATAEEVRMAVRALPEGPRQVLLMRIEGELPFADIARELGIPVNTALSWMHRATGKLRMVLGEKHGT